MFEQPSPTAHSGFSDLSGPALAVYRATDSGCGVLSIGRPWVQYEGWVLKEGGLAGGWHLRYFVVSGDRIEYFREERVKLDLPPDTSASAAMAAVGVELDRSNIVSAAPKDSSKGIFQQGDVVIGMNGEPALGGHASDMLSESSTGASTITLTVLRPRGRINLMGASVTATG